MGCAAMVTVRRLIGLRIRDQMRLAQRALLSAAVMALVVTALQFLLDGKAGDPAPALHLGMVVGAGMVTYVGTLLVLWNWAVRPASVEGDVVVVVGRLRGRMRRRLASMSRVKPP